MVRPRYDPETGEFKGLYETIGYLVVRVLLRKCSSPIAMTVKNRKFFIRTTEEEFQILSVGSYSIFIGP